MLGEHVAEVVQRVGVERILLDEIAERAFGIGAASRPIEGGPKLKEDAAVVRKLLPGGFGCGDRLGRMVCGRQSLDQHRVTRWLIGCPLDGFLERGNRLIMPLQLLQREPLRVEQQRSLRRLVVAVQPRDLGREKVHYFLVTSARLESAPAGTPRAHLRDGSS